MKIGIAITTFNRIEYLIEQIRLIQKFSLNEYELIVCDDGSTDETVDVLNREKINYITGKNKGIAWNKNRGIYYLANYTQADMFILLDDDIFPTMYGWDVEWAKAAQIHGHVTFVVPEWKDKLLYGDCNAQNPGISPLIAGSCITVSREAFPLVGYMDNRFGRYGHEHTDYSTRYVKSGFGGIVREDNSIVYAVMDSGLKLMPIPSTGSPEEARNNEKTLNDLKEEPLFRYPWFSRNQKQEFLNDLKDKSQIVHLKEWDIIREFDQDFYLETYPDVKAAGINPVQHYILYGCKENRKIKPE
ncbi:glycosyltransferase [Commensalibacter melissae]|uniref:Glycosyltransferase 2-like domain-containing protein n=1 Tax=Commensalibacter melissae TaxID=2070537 RepID=A0A318N177_9PROT|nr:MULTISPECIES: glycosyltransferase [Commensalibacter]MBH9970185.1 glycosyltransferase [Commensalibacter sp. M0265]MBH9977629.1 glycosyltransferase [Commensalibacter sp. M0266]MBH9993220.1 glycosyltransferase [Commensalibacter sp. M0270]MBI0046805.1 glycosyltransferase [Commensalibacter sp. M0267]MBI0056385.1 glycosyltransferase [Commensalibacter sp. M0268]